MYSECRFFKFWKGFIFLVLYRTRKYFWRENCLHYERMFETATGFRWHAMDRSHCKFVFIVFTPYVLLSCNGRPHTVQSQVMDGTS